RGRTRRFAAQVGGARQVGAPRRVRHRVCPQAHRLFEDGPVGGLRGSRGTALRRPASARGPRGGARMSARAIWKGVLRIEGFSVPVKLYSAVQDKRVSFRLL